MRYLILLLAALCFGFVLNAQTTIISEDFESVSAGTTPPVGWSRSQSTPSVGFEFGTSTQLASQFAPIPAHTKMAASNDDAHDDQSTTLNVADQDRLISPIMDLTPYAGTGVVAEFEYYITGTYGSTGSVEATTNFGLTWVSLQTLATGGNWQSGVVDLSAYTSSNSVQICFRHNDGGQWADALAVDDVVVRSLPTYDAKMNPMTTNPYAVIGNVTVEGEIENAGATTITSLDLAYSVNGGAPVTENFSGLNVPTAGSQAFSFSTPANFSSAGTNEICVWVAGNINGSNPDPNDSNDSTCQDISILSSIPAKSAILEDHTGAWCQFCPDGTVIAEDIEANVPNAIILSVHNSDAMAIPDGATIANIYISGYPSGTIDHYLFDDQGDVEINRGLWNSKMVERLAMTVPVAVSISSQSWNSTTREISFTVQADFVGDVNGDIRFNGYIVEDSVVGSGSGYDQVNFYNTQSGHPYFGAGNPIVGFVHNNVLREMLGGAWGTSGIIPSSVSDGNSYSQTYTYTLPPTYDETKISLVGLVQMFDGDPNAREILNAIDAPLQLFVGTEANTAKIDRIRPNPFSESTQLEFSLESTEHVRIEVLDLQGRTVRVLREEVMTAGVQAVRWRGDDQNGQMVSGGVYLFSVENAGQKMLKKVVLMR